MPQWFSKHQNVATLLSKIPLLIGKIRYKMSLAVLIPPFTTNGVHKITLVAIKVNMSFMMSTAILKTLLLCLFARIDNAYTPKGKAK